MKSLVDLFCGGGLGARGAVKAGMEPVLAVDLWDMACKTYEANFPTATVVNDRIENINPLDYCTPEEIDLLIASPECTNHSPAKGGAERDESSKETALHTAEWIENLRPRWFVIENVKEMLRWHRYPELERRLRQSYQIRTQVINAADFGSPQSRTRLFLIGGRLALPPEIVPDLGVTARTVRDILDPDGHWPMKPVFTEARAAKTKDRVRAAINAQGADAEFLLVYYGSGTAKSSWQSLDVPLRTVTTLDRFALVKKVNDVWCMRMLQPSELSRAMALPASHKLPVGSRRERVKLCGNGVCSAVMEAIVSQLKTADLSHSGMAQSQTGRGRHIKHQKCTATSA